MPGPNSASIVWVRLAGSFGPMGHHFNQQRLTGRPRVDRPTSHSHPRTTQSTKQGSAVPSRAAAGAAAAAAAVRFEFGRGAAACGELPLTTHNAPEFFAD